jgi:hypothetical protein
MLEAVLASRAYHCGAQFDPLGFPRSQLIVLVVAVSLQCFVGCADSRQSGACVSNNDCRPPESECRLGICRSPTSGRDAGTRIDGGLSITCASNGSCLLGQPCDSGVCCNEQCGQGCSSCNLVGSAGTCKPSLKGTACGAYACNGSSFTCPTQCAARADCAYAYTCCAPGTPSSETDCVSKGLTSKCFQLPSCASIQDNFNQAQLDNNKWASVSTADGGGAGVLSGNLRIDLGYGPQSIDAYTAVTLKQRVSIVGSSCQIEVVNASVFDTTNEFAVSGFILTDTETKGDFELRLLRNQAALSRETAEGRPDEAEVTGPSFPDAGRRFLRLSEDAGQVFFEYSSDGKAFITLTSIVPRLRPSDLDLSIAVYESAVGRDAGGAVLFDNFNVKQ